MHKIEIAITESAGYAFHSLSKDLQDEVIKECFSPNGLNYVLCRLPIGSCDFSIQSYSYSYQENLSDFSVKHDLKYMIPTIKAAQKENPSLSFLASPWSPPAFMISKKKDNYIKTPAFYYISHISRYAKPNAKRIHFSKFSDNICVTAFQNPDKSVMIVLLNKTDKSIEYNLCYQNKTFHDNLDSHAIVTWIIDEV